MRRGGIARKRGTARGRLGLFCFPENTGVLGGLHVGQLLPQQCATAKSVSLLPRFYELTLGRGVGE